MLKILIAIHNYHPNFASGAEIFAERIATYLGQRNEVRVMSDTCKESTAYKNHTVVPGTFRIAENYEWCDAVITHLVTRNQACDLAKRFNKPIFHCCHSRDIPYLKPDPDNYIIYNSYTLAVERPLSFESVVVQPVTNAEEWQPANGEYITLVNCCHNKGAETFYHLAQNMPYLKFMGVKGGYGQQMSKILPNLIYKPHTADMQAVYNMTRILVVPSINESWSLSASETQACGIPVVCSDLPGLRENLGDSAVYATGTRGFMDGINEVLSNYEYWRNLSLQRSAEKNHTLQLENLYTFMKEKVDKKAGAEKVVMPVVKEKKVIEKPVTKIKTT